jgi:hypothetical protein
MPMDFLRDNSRVQSVSLNKTDATIDRPGEADRSSNGVDLRVALSVSRPGAIVAPVVKFVRLEIQEVDRYAPGWLAQPERKPLVFRPTIGTGEPVM